MAVRGLDGPLAQAVREESERRGYAVRDEAPSLIYIPGNRAELSGLLASNHFEHVVLRSSVAVYGSDAKNPGALTEERGSILPPGSPERRRLELEELALEHGGACLRLSTVLAPEEGDLLARQLNGAAAWAPAGRDPQVQFLGVQDAARALVVAAEGKTQGVFNVSGDGSIPLKEVYRAAGVTRLPSPPRFPFSERSDDLAQLEFNTTVSSAKALEEFGIEPEQSSVEALRSFLKTRGQGNATRLRDRYDPWGLDEDYLRAWRWWFAFLRKVYWRIEIEGIENIPDSGRALMVSSHRGFMPLDAVMHLALIHHHRQRIPRFLIISSLLRTPFLSNFLTKVGGVIANQENAVRLFQAGNLVGVFPEGIRGAFTPYGDAYRLRGFERSGFAAMAVAHQAPIIPAAVVGHAEIFPILGRIDSAWTRRVLGWPYLPIAPMFPLAPVPIPSKWHIRYLPAIPVTEFRPADAANSRLMRAFARHVQQVVQVHTDDLVARRTSFFFGSILDGTGPDTSPFSMQR